MYQKDNKENSICTSICTQYLVLSSSYAKMIFIYKNQGLFTQSSNSSRKLSSLSKNSVKNYRIANFRYSVMEFWSVNHRLWPLNIRHKIIWGFQMFLDSKIDRFIRGRFYDSDQTSQNGFKNCKNLTWLPLRSLNDNSWRILNSNIPIMNVLWC